MLERSFNTIADGLTGAPEDLQELSRGIYPAILSEGCLTPRSRRWPAARPSPVELEVDVPGRLPEPVEVAAYYVVSEALASVAGVTAFALTVGRQRPAGRFALAAAIFHTAALGVWLGVVLPAGARGGTGPSDLERLRTGWELEHTVGFVLLPLLGFTALVLAVLWERPPRPMRRRAGAGAIP